MLTSQKEPTKSAETFLIQLHEKIQQVFAAVNHGKLWSRAKYVVRSMKRKSAAGVPELRSSTISTHRGGKY